MDHGSLVASAPAEGYGARSCDHHVDGFRQWLADLGYSPRTIKAKLRVVGALVCWMRDERVPLGDLEEDRAAAFVATRRRRRRRHCDGYEHAIRQFIEWLRDATEGFEYLDLRGPRRKSSAPSIEARWRPATSGSARDLRRSTIAIPELVRQYAARADDDINVRIGLSAALKELGVPHDRP